MPIYHYEALSASGQKSEGVVEAADTAQAVNSIRQSYEVVLRLEEIAAPKGEGLKKLQKLNMKALALMCKQFSIILQAGLPLIQTVDLVTAQLSNRVLRKLLVQVSEDLSAGWSLSYSFSQRGKGQLPAVFIESIRAGEESGDLIRAFERMASYYDRMSKTRTKAVNALIYPAFLTVVAILVIIIIMTFAVPTFSSVFLSLDLELPLSTRIVMGVSSFVSRYIWVLLGVTAAVILGLRLYGNTASGRIQMARWRLALPILGSISAMTSASQFSHTMSAMLSTGMPILRALDIAARSMDNAFLAQQIQQIIPGVENGQSLGECMQSCKDLPVMLVQMTAMGEATGSLESTLKIQAEYFDNEVDTLTTRALSLLEPIIICIMAAFVVLILLSIYLPMFSLYGAI